MRKKQLWQLLNDNKRDLSVKKPVKRWLRVVCKAFNGKSIYNDYKELVEGLKSDLTIYFTPANKFTRKQLKGLTASDLIEMQQRAEERDRKRKEVLSQNDKSNLTSVTNKTNVDNGFVNWFDLTPDTNTNELKKAQIISIKKADGSVVPLVSTDELDAQFD